MMNVLIKCQILFTVDTTILNKLHICYFFANNQGWVVAK